MKKFNAHFRIKISLVIFAVSISVLSVINTNAAGVNLDSSFGNNGIVNKTYGPVSDFPFKSAIQTDGKTVVVGAVTDGVRERGSIIRYNSDGTVDETFGIRSERIFAQEVQFFTDVAIQPDGKILVAGDLTFNNENWQFITRYNSDGNRDVAFGVKLAPRPVGGNYSIGSIELQSDGKILLAATLDPLSGRRDLFLTRFNSDGTLDTGFGTSGSTVTSTDVDNDESVIDMKLQSDGKIVIYSYVFSGVGGARRLGVFRYNTDGILDTTFGTSGVSIDDYGLFAFLPRGQMGIQSDDKIVFSGLARTELTGENKFLVIRYNADGTIDTTFDSDGVVLTEIQQRSNANALTIQSDGKILAGGGSSDGTTTSATIARYNSDGSLDTSFDTDGILINTVQAGSGISNIVEKSDGKLVGIGNTIQDSIGSFLLLGINADGSPNSSLFDQNGVAINSVGSRSNTASEIVIQPDGKIVSAGSSSGGSSISNIAISRYNSDGTPDSTFGTNGDVIIENGPSSNFIRVFSVALQSDGKIVAVGDIGTNGNRGISIVRLNTDGTADASFGTSGILTPTIGTGTAPSPYGRNIKVQTDGKIVVTGTFNVTGDSANIDNDIFVARFNSDGSFDTSFDTDGIATIANTAGNDVSFALKVQQDNKISVLGFINDGDTKTFDSTLIRFNADGTLDNTFNLPNAFGINVVSNFNEFECTSDGKYILGGSTLIEGTTNVESAVMKLNADGTPDTGFGINGIARIPASLDSNGLFNVAIQPDGKIIALGRSFFGTFPNNKRRVLLARLNTNGSLDNTFNGSGVKLTDLVLTNGSTDSLKLQTDGNIVISGFDYTGNNGRSSTIALLARFAITQPASTRFDFDGDARADLSIFRPNEGNWYFNASTNGFYGVHWGIANDKLTPADFDGDGITDVAVWRESENKFYILNSSDASLREEVFGIAGDNPTVVGDWDGDGKADIAVYREGTQSVFYYKGSNNNPNGNTTFLPFGITGDKPLNGDFDGDGKQDLAVFRPSNKVWYIRQSSDNQMRYENWGLPTDKFIPADYDGDSKTDLAVYRDGIWYIRKSSDNQALILNFGLADDVPVPADYDGDGNDDIAVYRDGVWYINQSTNGNVTVSNFGLADDLPIANSFID